MVGEQFRILLTASRDLGEQGKSIIETELSKYRNTPNAVLVHGGARGGDTHASRVWKSWGLPEEVYRPDYATWGRIAPLLRDQEMVESGIDVCIAVIQDNSHGASFTSNQAKKLGIKTINHGVSRNV